MLLMTAFDYTNNFQQLKKIKITFGIFGQFFCRDCEKLLQYMRSVCVPYAEIAAEWGPSHYTSSTKFLL